MGEKRDPDTKSVAQSVAQSDKYRGQAIQPQPQPQPQPTSKPKQGNSNDQPYPNNYYSNPQP